LAQHKANANPEGAFVRKKEQLYAEFWRTPKKSSVFPSGCEKAQIGFFKFGLSTLSQHKTNKNPEGALVRSKRSLYAQFWRTPKRSSVLSSGCEGAQIGLFKYGSTSSQRVFECGMASNREKFSTILGLLNYTVS